MSPNPKCKSRKQTGRSKTAKTRKPRKQTNGHKIGKKRTKKRIQTGGFAFTDALFGRKLRKSRKQTNTHKTEKKRKPRKQTGGTKMRICGSPI